MVRVPVTPGRNLASIIEVAARNHLLKGMGYHPAREFERQLLAKMSGRKKRKTRGNGVE
jgi:HPr kinase/phosphorylase